ncbi:MAG: hypothetical protein ACHBN1_26750 [Heteroscytonema crispum UTEX LB 1556]
MDSITNDPSGEPVQRRETLPQYALHHQQPTTLRENQYKGGKPSRSTRFTTNNPTGEPVAWVGKPSRSAPSPTTLNS